MREKGERPFLGDDPRGDSLVCILPPPPFFARVHTNQIAFQTQKIEGVVAHMPTRGQGGWGRNWDDVLKEYSSEDDGDEGDSANILSLQQNVHRVAQLARQILPVDPSSISVGEPPLGMRSVSTLHQDHERAIAASDPHWQENLPTYGSSSSSKEGEEGRAESPPPPPPPRRQKKKPAREESPSASSASSQSSQSFAMQETRKEKEAQESHDEKEEGGVLV